ncbi:MAG: tripartite tricarboxylate transporter substrate binding protein BugE [Burkholderiaceae bacterium]|nr:tripartite tricarboxylate transporter substrate binding protein BugE [Burkholderiaceae bacterium]
MTPSNKFSAQRRSTVLGLSLATVGWPVRADPSFPSKPIRLVVPFAPGGTTDIIARIVAPLMSADMGQQVIVDNKAGGGGIVGAMEVVRAPSDGYTLSVATVSTTAANPAINPKIPYDPSVDFVPITNLAATPNVLAVHPSFPARKFEELVTLTRANPGKFSYASSGTGGIGHLQTELLKSLTGLFIVHVPYRGAGPALNDTVAGQVPIIFDNLPSALPFIKSGRLRALAVAAPQRVPVLAEVPTFKELKLEPVNRMAFYGLLAPKGTPPLVVDRIHRGAKAALASADVRKRIEDTGSLVIGNAPAQFAQQMKEELALYRDVVKRQSLKLES